MNDKWPDLRCGDPEGVDVLLDELLDQAVDGAEAEEDPEGRAEGEAANLHKDLARHAHIVNAVP